jgi:TATA-binding protein-associated factor Taf7
MVEDSDTGLTIHQISEIEILQDEIRKIDEMIDKREHQTDQVYNSEMLSRFLKIINYVGQSDEEAKEWWMSRY